MCRGVTCKSCGKPTFAGCGAHVEQVLGDVPVEKRCQCAANAKKKAEPAGAKKSWWPF